MLIKLVKYSKSISRFYKDIKLFRFFNAVCFMHVGQVGLWNFIKISKKIFFIFCLEMLHYLALLHLNYF